MAGNEETERRKKFQHDTPLRWLAAMLPDLNIGGVWLAAATKQI
jgi:hypothetical protein